MQYIEWNNEEWTTIGAIANFYAEDDRELAKEIKPFIRLGVKKLSTIKILKKEIEKNSEIFKAVLSGEVIAPEILLIKTKDVPSIEKYFIFVLKQKKENTYKKDRFHSKRGLLEELRLELDRNKYRVSSDEFKAVLSFASRLEHGQPKIGALRSASKKFKVTQVRINEIVNSLDIQIDYKNKPKDYR